MIRVYLNEEYHCGISVISQLNEVIVDLEEQFDGEQVLADCSELDIFVETGSIYLKLVDKSVKL